jgi:uncharacterized protein
MKNLTWRSEKTFVQPSPIQGVGLFARESFTKNEIVAIKGGYIIDYDTWKTMESELGCAYVQVSDDFFIAPINKDNRDGALLCTNHSCDPNVAIQGQIVLVAMRDINAGEELTHDWATMDHAPGFEMLCHCKSSCCRGYYRGEDWRREDLQEKYKGWFSWFIQRKIDALSNH